MANIVTFGELFFVRAGFWAAFGLLVGLLLLALACCGVDAGRFTLPLLVLLGSAHLGLAALVGVAASRAILEASGRPCYVIKERLSKRRREAE